MFSLYKKELQSFFLSPLAYIVAALFMGIFSYNFIVGISNLSGTNILKFSFPNVFYNNFFFFIFLIPALTMKSFPEERKNKTEVLLMSSPLSVTKIVLSKFLSVSTVFAFMTVLTAVYPILGLLMGGNIVWSALISAYIGFYLWGEVCIAIGIFVSSFFESNITSIIVSEIAMVLLVSIDVLSNSAFISNTPVVSKIFEFFSTQSRFTVFSQGLFRISDIIFYLSLIIIFVIFTIIVIEKRRWSRG